MPEIRYTMKVKYGYVQEWEFESDCLGWLSEIVEMFKEYLKKPAFDEINIVISPYIVVKEGEEDE